MQEKSRTSDNAVSHLAEPYRSSDLSIVPNGFRPFERVNLNRPTISPSHQVVGNQDPNCVRNTVGRYPDPDLSETSDEDSDNEQDKATLFAQDRQIINPLPFSTLPTGLCYDARMRFHCELDPPKDRSNYHPEDPRRIFHIYRTLCEAGLVKDQMAPQHQIVNRPLHRIPARHANKSEICLVHDERHFEFMESTRGSSNFAFKLIDPRTNVY